MIVLYTNGFLKQHIDYRQTLSLNFNSNHIRVDIFEHSKSPAGLYARL